MTFSELNLGCRTYRRFLQEPIPEEILREMTENARIASSAANRQVLRYAIVQSPEMVAKIQPLVKWAAFLPPELGTPKEDEQPTAFLIISRKEPANAFSDIDVGIACDKICMTAWEHGIGSCIMASINGKKIQQILGQPEDTVPRIAIALGKPSHKSTIVPVPESGDLAYYVDENVDYYVPKRPFDAVAKIY